MKAIGPAVSEFWGTLAEMSPYLLFGFGMAGLLYAFLSPGQIRRHLGGRGFWPVFKASAFGIPLPLCSCSVIPVGMSLYTGGASKAATVAFLLSTPQTGVDSISVTLGLLGPVFAIVRPVMALVTGLLGGVLAGLWDGSAAAEGGSSECHCRSNRPGETSRNRLTAAIRHAFVTLPRDIGRPLLVGLVLSAMISVLVPDDFFSARLGRGVVPMLVMMVVGIPIYVCATASVPMAAAMILKGLSPGAALVFLMTGPATNAVGLATIWRALGAKAAGAYLGAVGVCALASGLILDWLVARIDLPLVHSWHWMPGRYVANASAMLLLALMIGANAGPLIAGFRARRQALGQ